MNTAPYLTKANRHKILLCLENTSICFDHVIRIRKLPSCEFSQSRFVLTELIGFVFESGLELVETKSDSRILCSNGFSPHCLLALKENSVVKKNEAAMGEADVLVPRTRRTLADERNVGRLY